MPRSPRSHEAVAALLRDLGPQLQQGLGLGEGPLLPHLPTGLRELDRLLAGGFPRGRLSEIAGPLSSGRTSLALGLLAGVTRTGELAAVVDGTDAFDPASADAAGADLARVLWARANGVREALRCAESLLAARGFAVVLLDLPAPVSRGSWTRLARAAASTGTALVTLALERTAGTCADLAVETRARHAHFSDTPVLLERLETEVALVRCRTAPADRVAHVRLHSPLAA